MKTIEGLGHVVINTDVLVIGGGVAGLPAAIKAKERGLEVLLVDKGGIGWAGQMVLTGAGSMFLQPGEIDQWFKWVVEAGEYLNNQECTYAFGNDHDQAIKETAALGAPFLKDANGQVVLLDYYKHYSYTRYQPRLFNIKLKQAATSRGVKMLDKVFIADLLQREDKVVGAIGFGIVDGKTYIIKAKSTILANGSCLPQVHRAFVANGGEGEEMAYRAGAQLMNAEFGGTYGFGFKRGDVFIRAPMYLFYENALGERFMEKYYPELMSGLERGQETENFTKIADAMAKEVEAGRGPIYIDFRKLTPEELEVCLRKEKTSPPEFQFAGRGSDVRKFLREQCGTDVDKERAEVTTQYMILGGALRVGVDCQTTVDGLWAAGDICQLGSAWIGAVTTGTFPGWGVSFALVTGLRAGRNAADYAATAGGVEPISEDVERSIKRMFKPFGRKGAMASHEVIRQVQEVVMPLKYGLHREERAIQDALHKLEIAKRNLDNVGAKDHHELFQYHQAEGIIGCAERSHKAALMRQETRGAFHRVDYPRRDDKNWLKWIVVEKKKGDEKWFTEPVPIEKYQLKPPAK